MAKKTLAYQLFRVGKLPRTVRTAIEPERIRILEEGIRVIITCRNFRNSTQFFSWKKRSFSGAIAVTSERLVAYAFSQRILNLPFRHLCFRKMEAGKKENNCFYIRINAAHINEKMSGILEYCFITPDAGNLDNVITNVFNFPPRSPLPER
ncbi:hypothetical protein DENIS_4692 [Desulfonema ishimotonii]|uniref:Uncharacterized protein n=1 Tax=Desulfonema ishimotonii TaxID=45657 RepID=A0A401G398_9BACT|nr:hypothetical protein [Desulfonema ishimotonii]GBC63694.1 hypothetical protein DENIS_4692 [Desulfonema ishimotonii]